MKEKDNFEMILREVLYRIKYLLLIKNILNKKRSGAKRKLGKINGSTICVSGDRGHLVSNRE